jgi:hypothetical protein
MPIEIRVIRNGQTLLEKPWVTQAEHNDRGLSSAAEVECCS